MDTEHPLQECWRPESQVLIEALPELTEALEHRRTGSDRLSDASVVDLLKEVAAHGAEVLSCVSALPHIDTLSDRWSALWVLSANGHSVSSANIRDDGYGEEAEEGAVRDWGQMDIAADQETTLQPGDILLLDVHRLHWLDLRDSNVSDWAGSTPEVIRELSRQNTFSAVFLEFENRPSREEVEDRLISKLGLELKFSGSPAI